MDENLDPRFAARDGRHGFVLWMLACLGACAHSIPAAKPAAQPTTAQNRATVVDPGAKAQVDANRPWGAPVPDATTEKRARAILSQVVAGPAERVSQLARPLVLGPALWSFLLRTSPMARDFGTPGTAVISHTDGSSEAMPMRTFSDDNAIARLAGQPSFLRLLGGFVTGTARAADEEERKLFYAIVPIEIVGKPLTILQTGDDRLAVILNEDRVVWLDLLSAYHEPKSSEDPAEGPTKR